MGSYEHTPEIAELVTALAAAQAQMANPGADSDNPHFKTRYASLAAVRDAVTKPLAEQGIAVTQLVDTGEKSVTCTTILLHKSGQWLKMTMELPVSQPTAQGYGGGITYARRYSLMAICNVAGDEDDDGNSASSTTTYERLGKGKAARSEARVNRMTGEITEEDQATLERRTVVLREIARSLKGIVVPLQHAGLYKAILHHCFEAEHHTLKEQSLTILEAGLPLFRHLCDELQTQHWERTQHPDEWIAQEQRKLAALARGDAPTDEESAAEDPGTTGASWGPETPDLMAAEEEEEPWGRPSPAAYPQN